MIRLSSGPIAARASALIHRFRAPRLRSLATVSICLAMLGCFDARHVSHRASASHRKPRAWFDAKGTCVFPLVGDSVPSSRQELIDALTEGWKKHLKFNADSPDIITATGGRFPTVSTLKMELSGAKIDLTKDNKKTKPTGKVEDRLFVNQFELDGRPLLAERATMNLRFTASGARLDFEHDEGGRPVLMLADARKARLDFQATRSDLERILLVSAREAGRKYGVSVDKVDLKLDAQSSHSIDVDLHLSTKVGFIPAGLRFQAHAHIDSDMNAKLSNLKCDGDEALGPLIVNIIRPGLARYEARSKPVFSFPTGELKLRDVQFQTGQDIHVTALFEN